MMPEHLYLLNKVLQEQGKDYSYFQLNDTYNKLSEHTKNLYRTNEHELFKKAIRFELDNGLNSDGLAKTFTRNLIEQVTQLMKNTDTKIDELSTQTGIPESVIRTMVNYRTGSIENVMIILNHFGKGLKIIDWSQMFTNEPARPYTPFTLKPLSLTLYNVLTTAYGADNVPAGIDIGFDIEFKDFQMDAVSVLELSGQLAGYDTSVYTNSAFSDGAKLLLTGVIDEVTYDYLLNLHLLYPKHEALYIGGQRTISLEHLLLSLYTVDGDTNRYFILDIPVPTNDPKRVEVVSVIDNESFTSYIDFSEVNFTPFTESVEDNEVSSL